MTSGKKIHEDIFLPFVRFSIFMYSEEKRVFFMVQLNIFQSKKNIYANWETSSPQYLLSFTGTYILTFAQSLLRTESILEALGNNIP